MSWSRSIQVSPFQGSASPFILGRSLSSICVDINATVDHDGRKYSKSPRMVWSNNEVSLSPSLSSRLRIVNKRISRSESPKILKIKITKILAHESERMSRKLTNYLCLQVLDGEKKLFKRKASASAMKKSFDLILEQERKKRKVFQFPEEAKFKTEDDKFFGTNTE